MDQLYPVSASPQRLPSREMRDTVDHRRLGALALGSLRVLADNLADVPAPLRVVPPRDLDACGSCPEHFGLAPDPSVADVVYTVGAWTYREAACEPHVRGVVRWHQRHGKAEIHVEIPAPTHLYVAAVA